MNNIPKTLKYNNQKRILRTLPQTQKKGVNKVRDRERKALMPGKRISRTGKVYWETRASRSDQKGSRL
jgi:hypothetical protein